MKPNVLAFIRVSVFSMILLGFTINTSAQWTKKNSGSSTPLFAVDFVNDKLGFAAGNGGTILRTRDGGDSWEKLTSGVSGLIYSIHFVNEMVGFAVDPVSTTIIKTNDGGDSWNVLTTNAAGALEVFFVDENIGFASGDGGNIMKSTDGGQTWTALFNSGQNSNERVVFLNDRTGFIAGNGIVKTTNGGISWSQKYGNANTFFYSVYFFNEQIGFACGVDGTIIKTTDGGET